MRNNQPTTRCGIHIKVALSPKQIFRRSRCAIGIRDRLRASDISDRSRHPASRDFRNDDVLFFECFLYVIRQSLLS